MKAYEILIRFAPDGSLAGAHYITQETTPSGKVVISEPQPLPVPLPENVLGELGAGVELTMQTITAREAELRQANAALAKSQRAVRDLEKKLATAKQQKAAPAAAAPLGKTKREIVDALIELGAAEKFANVLDQLPTAERLRWDTSLVIEKNYPFIAENRAMLLSALELSASQFDAIWD